MIFRNVMCSPVCLSAHPERNGGISIHKPFIRKRIIIKETENELLSKRPKNVAP